MYAFGSDSMNDLQVIFSCSQTIHRFAQFFISPLLKEDSVDREIQAVESGMESITVQQLAFIVGLQHMLTL